MLTIGIDFGTTNCSASVYRDGRLELIPLENGQPVLPSTICITKEREVHFGQEAIELYLTLTRETPIHYKFTDLREVSAAHVDGGLDPVVETEKAWVYVSPNNVDDEDSPARLFQSLKTGLRDPSFNGTTIYGRYYAVEDLIALVLGHIRECAEAYLGEPVHAAVIGRPLSYVPHDETPGYSPEEVDHTAHERMLAAARIAGFTHAGLEFEPVAAARHLRASLPEKSRALVFDFGGGTLDLALAQMEDDGAPEIIATHGVPIGGDDFDSALMAHCLLKHFGQGTTLGPKRLDFPENLLAPLLHWQTVPLLASSANAAHIAAIRRQSNSPKAVENLQILIRQGLGFRLFQLIEAAKIALSERPTATISLHEAGLDIEETITRAAFVTAISDYLLEIDDALRHVLRKAKLVPDQVDAVLMTGGSSLVPAVQKLVQRIFGDRVRVADPFTSIAAGLGIIAARDDIVQAVDGFVASATEARLKAEAVTIGERVAFTRGDRTAEGLVVRRAGGRLHDATLIIEFWDPEIEQFVSTMRHETKVTRLRDREA
jgi:hypothetical chaperone protein